MKTIDIFITNAYNNNIRLKAVIDEQFDDVLRLLYEGCLKCHRQ